MAPSSTASAIPDQLSRYAGAAGELDDVLRRLGGEVQDALDAFAAASSDVVVPVQPLGDELVALGDASATVDRWVGDVGEAFRRADRGWRFLQTLLELWQGITYDPVTARPDWTDEQVRAALEALLGLDPAREPGAIVQPLVPPDVVRTFMASLTPAQRDGLLDQHPELVGPVDGMPHELRYAANRVLIDRALARARLDGDHELVETLEGLGGEGRQFLFFDPAGDGRAVEVFGDLATADDVTVFVPGITNTLENFSGTRGNAQRVFNEMNLLDPGGDHATIAWLGYDTPGLTDAPLAGRAHEAAPLLRQLWEGLDLPDAVNTTNIGHSYGSLVSATALRDGFRGVDTLVVIGSPGLEADNVDDLDLAEGMRFFAGRAPFDGVSLSEGFGRDPADPRFGGIRFETGEAPGGFVTGHSSYTDDGSESLSNLALIALGDHDDVSVIEPSFAERVSGAVDDLHAIVQEGPVDLLQLADEGIDGLLDGTVDGIQERVPLGPVGDLLDSLQWAGDTVDAYGDSLIDGLQRLTSPDLVTDVLGDWFAVDGPGRLVDGALERGERVVDRVRDGVDTVVDTGEAVVDEVLDTAGDAIDAGEDAVREGLEQGGELAEDVYDSTLGRLPGL